MLVAHVYLQYREWGQYSEEKVMSRGDDRHISRPSIHTLRNFYKPIFESVRSEVDLSQRSGINIRYCVRFLKLLSITFDFNAIECIRKDE